ncbi:MAG: hypothetical protein ACRC4W_09250 [Treponemataceae bacterium]
MGYFKKIISLFIIWLVPSVFFSFETVLSIHDSSDIRAKIANSWFNISIPQLLEQADEYHLNKTGQVFKVSVIDYGPEVAIAVVPRQKNYVFATNAAGSWLLYKDKLTGEKTKIRYYFQAESDVYIQIRTGKTKNFADMVIFGMYAACDVPIGLDMDTLLTKSFSFIHTLTKTTLPWDYVQVSACDYASIIQMITLIRENLYLFEYIADAVYDEQINPVHLTDGTSRSDTPARLGISTEGFSKWLIDGLVLPIMGKATDVSFLQTQTVMNYSKLSIQTQFQNEPNKGLNWTRNLAMEALSSIASHRLDVQNTNIDVKSNFFYSFLNSENNFKGLISYAEDIGYHADVVLPLMYVLAAQEAGYFFLASMRENASDTQELWKFEDTAVFFPYFDANGRFQLVIFINGMEIPFETFYKENKNNFVHFTRVKAGERFVPITPYIMTLQANR